MKILKQWMTTPLVATWFQSLGFILSDWPRWKGQMDLSWPIAALPQEACKCIVNWVCLQGFCCESVSWQLGPRKVTKVTPPHARDLLVCRVWGKRKATSEQGWKHRYYHVVMFGFVGGMELTHGDNTEWWKGVPLEMTRVLVSYWRRGGTCFCNVASS